MECDYAVRRVEHDGYSHFLADLSGSACVSWWGGALEGHNTGCWMLAAGRIRAPTGAWVRVIAEGLPWYVGLCP